MELKQAEMLFRAGALTNPEITNAVMKKGWIITFMKKDNEKLLKTDFYTSRRSGNEPKTFKDLNSAINAVKKIGFDEVKIINLQK